MNLRLWQQPAGNSKDQSNGVGTGYGTMNVHRRIQLHYGDAYGLRYLEVSEGTCVEVVLPCRLEPSE
ncbi:hypothetical protein O9H85_09915 [Paenibacillus filicis]|uniref:Uncharacterized protein n=2 Tax=Paenibacillus gyeongsangnamensis TaxID=3388067 RepID=A0ABT4Q783_9BACL|nr:hypothetical protein [Paenibacillus filicis]MCZ8512724.1 hypothetical protein [Paenibacillus filicis]